MIISFCENKTTFYFGPDNKNLSNAVICLKCKCNVTTISLGPNREGLPMLLGKMEIYYLHVYSTKEYSQRFYN